MPSSRRCRVVLSIGAVLVAAWALPAGASSAPTTIPDLASMVLQATDLAPGSVHDAGGYIEPLGGFTAEYVDSFKKASTPDGVGYYEISDAVDFATNASRTIRFFRGERHYFRSPSGRGTLAFEVINKAGPKADLQLPQVRIRIRGGFGVGDGSFLETASVHVHHIRLEEDLVLVDQGPVFALLIIGADPGQAIPRADAVAMGRAVDSHITTVLGQSGATGPSGVSGST